MSVVGGAASRRLVQAERERDALSLPWCVVSVSYLRALVSGGGLLAVHNEFICLGIMIYCFLLSLWQILQDAFSAMYAVSSLCPTGKWSTL